MRTTALGFAFWIVHSRRILQIINDYLLRSKKTYFLFTTLSPKSIKVFFCIIKIPPKLP